ncbi:hypothetical protein [Nakamurella leprariae]|uniref:MarR family transcriptional regulator n=1 Tax=Nakamurella leprariae TaxID=2803911 RepID=A0A938YIH8_9ACTN|nr:hypothetical protein [Nakamurella leprariae]MBM9468468.1 hypothetical protein [Nakamurella leprariae]
MPFGVRRQAVQRVANDLTRDGLTEWVTNPGHRSTPLLALTPDGTPVLAAITARARVANQAPAEYVTADEITTLRRGLAGIVTSARAVDPDPVGHPFGADGD